MCASAPSYACRSMVGGSRAGCSRPTSRPRPPRRSWSRSRRSSRRDRPPMSSTCARGQRGAGRDRVPFSFAPRRRRRSWRAVLGRSRRPRCIHPWRRRCHSLRRRGAPSGGRRPASGRRSFTLSSIKRGRRSSWPPTLVTMTRSFACSRPKVAMCSSGGQTGATSSARRPGMPRDAAPVSLSEVAAPCSHLFPTSPLSLSSTTPMRR